MSLIEQLSRHGGPQIVAPGWAVRIDIHYLGGLRHFGNWEVADIGVLVFAKQGATVVAKKTALLQSKRLYPNTGGIAEESPEDYRIGFGGMLPSPGSSKSLALSHKFDFTDKSKYKALKVADDQYKAIASYEEEQKLDVHYLFYNPWAIDASYSYPRYGGVALGPLANGGCRVISAGALRTVLLSKAAGYSPTFADLSLTLPTTSLISWRLEDFISHQLMKCKQGNLFQGLDQDNIYSLFNRRSGPIAAAIAVTVEQFSG